MAGANLLALLDDIASILDDVAMLTKVAAKKTAGVLGDDLALNAEQVTGVHAERELPVIWAVAKGAIKNKFILVPVALLLSAVFPWLITPLLMLGGAYLCFEGFEKIAHKYLVEAGDDDARHAALANALSTPEVDMVTFEKEKISGAIRTDFILSAEIIVIALGTVKDADFMVQAIVVSCIALLVTLVVYGLVAVIVKLDDAGIYLLKSKATGAISNAKRSFGRLLLLFAPRLMKSLSVVGTIAMFLVGGGILVHGLPFLAALSHHVEEIVASIKTIGFVLAVIVPILMDGFFGVLMGGALVGGATGIKRLRAK